MNRLAPLLLIPVIALAGCAVSAPTPANSPAPADSPGMTQAEAPAAMNGTTPGGAPTTPDPLPQIPPRAANEIVRSTFDGTNISNENATHAFTGQTVTLHVLCASYDGVIDLTLFLDGEEQILSTNTCDTPSFSLEDDSIPAGSHEVSLVVESAEGAKGVAYLVEGDI